MNPKQRLVLIIGSIAVLLLVVFPPWVYQLHNGNAASVRIAGRHSFVFAPPSSDDAFEVLMDSAPDTFLMEVWLDGPRLAGELAGVVLATTGLVLAFWRREEETKRSGSPPVEKHLGEKHRWTVK